MGKLGTNVGRSREKWSAPLVVGMSTHEVHAREIELAAARGAPCDLEDPGDVGIR